MHIWSTEGKYPKWLAIVMLVLTIGFLSAAWFSSDHFEGNPFFQSASAYFQVVMGDEDTVSINDSPPTYMSPIASYHNEVLAYMEKKGYTYLDGQDTVLSATDFYYHFKNTTNGEATICNVSLYKSYAIWNWVGEDHTYDSK